MMAKISSVQLEVQDRVSNDISKVIALEYYVDGVNQELAELFSAGWTYDGFDLVDEVLCFSRQGYGRTVRVPIECKLVVLLESGNPK